ncbi:hypothetical protein [Rhodococcus koreensis]
MSENKPGRPRVYESDADRVRAFRARKRQEAAAVSADVPADPAEAAAALAQVLPLLRLEAGGAIEKLSAVADRIATAVDLLDDPAAIDAHLRRTQVAADKVRADAAAEIEQLRDQLETAIDDRANADAAAEDAAAALADTQRQHAEQLDALTAVHQEELSAHAEVLDRVASLDTEIAQVRGDAERAAAAAVATIGRLEADLAEARAAVTAERTRADAVRDELSTTRADLAAARAQTDAAKERIEELRTELAQARAASR